MQLRIKIFDVTHRYVNMKCQLQKYSSFQFNFFYVMSLQDVGDRDSQQIFLFISELPCPLRERSCPWILNGLKYSFSSLKLVVKVRELSLPCCSIAGWRRNGFMPFSRPFLREWTQQTIPELEFDSNWIPLHEPTFIILLAHPLYQFTTFF